jgi:hypothetical protein
MSFCGVVCGEFKTVIIALWLQIVVIFFSDEDSNRISDAYADSTPIDEEKTALLTRTERIKKYGTSIPSVLEEGFDVDGDKSAPATPPRVMNARVNAVTEDVCPGDGASAEMVPGGKGGGALSSGVNKADM